VLVAIVRQPRCDGARRPAMWLCRRDVATGFVCGDDATARSLAAKAKPATGGALPPHE
jgi:hypothetical protein